MGEITDLIFLVLGKSGRWFNVRGKRICFLIWIACVIYWAVRNGSLGLKAQCAGCIFSAALHAYGYFNWGKNTPVKKEVI